MDLNGFKPLGETSGTGMFNIRQQSLRQEVGQEALGMWGIDPLKDDTVTHGGRGLSDRRDTLGLCRDSRKM